MLFVETDLDRRKCCALRQALDRLDVTAIDLRCEHGARLDRLPFEEHRECSAARRVTADMRPREQEVGAKEIDEQDPRLDLAAALRSVDAHRHFHAFTPWACASAAFRPRCTKTRTMSFLYAADPRTSSLGWASAAASRAASAITSSFNSLPTSARSAAVAFRLVGPTDVIPMPAFLILRPSNSICTATATEAKSPTLRSSL